MAQPTIIPPPLQKGDTIAFVSPSTRFSETYVAPIARSKEFLENLGFHVVVINHGPLKGKFVEDTRQRCDELHEAFEDPEVKMVLCTSGGDNANELLRRLDYNLIRANPKIFCGYSDITNLHNALMTQAGLRTFYGPCSLHNLADYPKPLDFTVNHMLKVLTDTSGTPIGPFPRSQEWAKKEPSFVANQAAEDPRELSPSPGWSWLRPGKGKGRILGGVLTSLLEAAGTPYWPDFNGAILLIESSFGPEPGSPVPLTKTRYQLADLANIGVFDQINGLVFGRLVGQSEELDRECAQLLLDQTHGTNFPILFNVDVGHTDPILTVPLNSMVSLDSEKDEWIGLEPGVQQ